MPDDLRHEIGELTIALLALSKLPLSLDAVGDIDIDAEDPAAARLVRPDNRSPLDPTHLSVGSYQPQLQGEFGSRWRYALLSANGLHAFAIIGMGVGEKSLKRGLPFADPDAELTIAAR